MESFLLSVEFSVCVRVCAHGRARVRVYVCVCVLLSLYFFVHGQAGVGFSTVCLIVVRVFLSFLSGTCLNDEMPIKNSGF